MKPFQIIGAVFCIFVLLFPSFCIGAGRRPPNRRPRPPYLQGSTKPGVTRYASNRVRGPSHNRPWVGRPGWQQAIYHQETENGHETCRRRSQILYDFDNPQHYKVCVPIGGNWRTVSYKCPVGTALHFYSFKCTRSAVVTVPTTEASVSIGTTTSTFLMKPSHHPSIIIRPINKINQTSEETTEPSLSSSEEEETEPASLTGTTSTMAANKSKNKNKLSAFSSHLIKHAYSHGKHKSMIFSAFVKPNNDETDRDNQSDSIMNSSLNASNMYSDEETGNVNGLTDSVTDQSNAHVASANVARFPGRRPSPYS